MDDAQPGGAGREGPGEWRGMRGVAARSAAEQRVLVLVQSEADASLARAAADKSDVELDFVSSMAELAAAIQAGAGAAMLGDEMLAGGTAELRRALDRQRRWSELPVIVLFREHAPPAALDALEEFELHSRVKVVLLHRPVPTVALVSALRSALKSRRRQYEVRDLLSRLNRDVRSRDEFLAMLGHELRNPLSSIGYVAEIFRKSGEAPAPEQARWGADVIGRQLRQLSRLLDQLLDVARVQRGKIRLEAAAVDLGSLVRASAEAFDAHARGRDLLLSLPAEPVRVRGDPLRLTQIVESLLDNAFKYTEEGGRVSIAVARDGEALLTVRDDGRGIRASALEHVFEPFYQETRSRDDRPRGLGLGLALVENLVRLHGGRVRARSPGAGRGAEFEVRLPLAADTPDRRPEGGAVRPLRVLVVENDPDSAEAFSSFVNTLHCEIEVAYDGTSGLELLDDLDVDVAFIDVGLAHMDAERFARRARSRLGVRTPYLVALKGAGESGGGEAFDEVLPKPVGRERVESLFSRLR